MASAAPVQRLEPVQQKLNDIDADVLEQAADWVDRIAEGDESELSLCRDWLSENPSHLIALERLAAVYGDSLLPTALRALPAPATRENVVNAGPPARTGAQGATDQRSGNVVSLDAGVRRRKAWRLPLAAAATLLMALGLSLWWGTGFEQPEQPAYRAAIATAIGERDSLQTDDGSLLHINAATRLDVIQSRGSREVNLHQGEVYFDVATDRNRPFRVRTGALIVEVTGTRFNVDRQRDSIEVWVDEGSVRVIGSSEVALSAGQRLRSVGDRPGEPEAIPPGMETATWRSGWVQVDGRPLGDVVRQLQRYLNLKVVIADGVTRSSLVSGRFNLDRADETLQLIASLHGLQLRENRGYLILSRD